MLRVYSDELSTSDEIWTKREYKIWCIWHNVVRAYDAPAAKKRVEFARGGMKNNLD